MSCTFDMRPAIVNRTVSACSLRIQGGLHNLEVTLVCRHDLVDVVHRDIPCSQHPAVEPAAAADLMGRVALDQPTGPDIEACHPVELEPQLTGRLARVAALVLVLVETSLD